MEQIEAAVIGTGWCGGIRAQTLARHPLVRRLHLAENREERLAETVEAADAAEAATPGVAA